jgi:hypothetical protein
MNCECGGWQYSTVENGRVVKKCIACKTVEAARLREESIFGLGPKMQALLDDKLRKMGIRA